MKCMQLTGVFLMTIFGECCFVAVDLVASSLNNLFKSSFLQPVEEETQETPANQVQMEMLMLVNADA